MNDQPARATILIVDDMPMNIRFLGEALKADYHVRFAINGEKGLEIAQSAKPPDLILLDIMMPGLNGYEVCQRLKADPQTLNIPIIFITAMNQDEDETRGLECGAVDYITKPFSLPIVKMRIKTHLELQRHRDALERLCMVDGLTGIYNRRRFDEYLAIEWKRAERDGSFLALSIIDIDFFKIYNDTYGHQAGDDCLKQVAHILAASVKRPADFVARYGGEEFASILPGTDRRGAAVVCENMRLKLTEAQIPHLHSPVIGYITISQGAACIQPAHGNSIEYLLQMADKALYLAKKEGRNRIKYVDLTVNTDFQ